MRRRKLWLCQVCGKPTGRRKRAHHPDLCLEDAMARMVAMLRAQAQFNAEWHRAHPLRPPAFVLESP